VGKGKGKDRPGKGKNVLGLNIGYSVFYFIIVLGILVFIHEFGHFIVAKKLGVGVVTFSLGFGPKLIGRKVGETEYKVSVVPLGGYVKLVGESREEDVKEEDRARSFFLQPIWKRALIIFAGPFFNLSLALVFLCFSFLLFGIPQEQLPLPSKIGGLSADLPAEKAGLQVGDTVLSVDGVPVTTWDNLSSTIRKSEGREMTLQVDRNGKRLEFKVRPELSKEKPAPTEKPAHIIGIVAPLEEATFLYKKVGVGEALSEGVVQTWFWTKLTMVFVGKMITGEISRKNIGGPIEIARQAGKQGRKGLPYLLGFIALLGVNLALFNLFPIPILDGGHLLFLAIEAVLGGPISMKKMEIAQQFGLILIILLMVFAFYNDLIRSFWSRGLSF
jgi:regulator of sigma E protease